MTEISIHPLLDLSFYLLTDSARRRLRLRSANLNRLTVPRCRLTTYGCRAIYHAGPVAVLGEIFWGSGPSSFGRQQRVSEITTEPINSASSRTTVSNCSVSKLCTIITFYTGLQNILFYTNVGIKISAPILTRSQVVARIADRTASQYTRYYLAIVAKYSIFSCFRDIGLYAYWGH